MKKWKILLLLLIVLITSTIFWFYFNSTRAERQLAERIPTKAINVEVNLTKALKLRSWFKGDTTKGFDFIRNFKPNPLVKAHVFGNDTSAIFVAFENAVDVDAQKIESAIKNHPRWHFTHEGKSCLLGRASEADFDSVKTYFLAPKPTLEEAKTHFDGLAMMKVSGENIPLLKKGSAIEIEIDGDTFWLNKNQYLPSVSSPFAITFSDSTTTQFLQRLNKKNKWVEHKYNNPITFISFEIRDTVVREQKSITYEYDDDFNKIEKVVIKKQTELDFGGIITYAIDSTQGQEKENHFGNAISTDPNFRLQLNKRQLGACLKAAKWPSEKFMKKLDRIIAIDMKEIEGTYTGYVVLSR